MKWAKGGLLLLGNERVEQNHRVNAAHDVGGAHLDKLECFIPWVWEKECIFSTCNFDGWVDLFCERMLI